MFDKKFEDRMSLWREFRDMLEVCDDPIQTAIDFYNQAPATTLAIDPYTQSTWPDPWQLLEENVYCKFVKILAICYSLQLTDRLSTCKFEINITRDNKNSNTYYLLMIDNFVVGFNGDSYVHRKDLPPTVYSELEYKMSPLH